MAFDAVLITDESGTSFESLKLNDYYLCLDLDSNISYQYNKNNLTNLINIPEFKLSVYSTNAQINTLDLLTLLDKLQEQCINNYTYIPEKYPITDNIYFNRIIFNKHFSKFLPYIPLIVINKKQITDDKKEIIKINDKFLGILIKNNIIPMIILVMIIKNYINNNNKLYIPPCDIKYNVAISESSPKSEYALVIRDKYKLSNNNYINKGDYIWELNNYTFNKMGFIYLPEINSSVHINTFMLLKGTNNIILKYTSHIYTNKLSENINITIPVKTTKFRIDNFNSNKLKIPILNQPIVKFREKSFTILSEELIKSNNWTTPIDLESYNNYYTNNNFVVMINNDNLVVINKISGKSIFNMDTFVAVTSKILSKNKRKFEVEDNNDLPSIIYI